jgi:hypothetical protein
MNIKTHQLFAQLCESIVFEDSTALDLIKGQPGGAAVIKALHKTYGLAHDQDYVKIAKMSWSSFKAAQQGSWAIFKYPNGTGAIKQSSENYTVLASTGGEVETLRETHGGSVMDWLKLKLGGNPIAMYIGVDTGETRELKRDRDRLKTPSGADEVTVDSLTTKFKPLWVRACNSAIADVKGMVGIMLKNDSFEKATKKMETLRKLTTILQYMETDSGGMPSYVRSTVADAVTLSAAHYYPDESGRLMRGSGYGDYPRLSPNDREGIEKLLQDISQGDQAKLGTVLAFFKQRLMLL